MGWRGMEEEADSLTSPEAKGLPLAQESHWILCSRAEQWPGRSWGSLSDERDRERKLPTFPVFVPHLPPPVKPLTPSAVPLSSEEAHNSS